MGVRAALVCGVRAFHGVSPEGFLLECAERGEEGSFQHVKYGAGGKGRAHSRRSTNK